MFGFRLKVNWSRGIALALVLVMAMTMGLASVEEVFAGEVQAGAEAATETEQACYRGGKVWFKVNKGANVVTAYELQGGKWVPVRAMAASCGGKATPVGTFRTSSRYRWRELMGKVYGQYNTRVVGGILFHSVWYHKKGDKASQSGREFNKLGRTASHGCIRLSVIDAKWVYDHCPAGTKVTIFSSRDAGPLGVPRTLKVRRAKGWDPTDPDRRNPSYGLKGPVISVMKDRVYGAGSVVDVLEGVSAYNYFANENLSDDVRVASVKFGAVTGEAQAEQTGQVGENAGAAEELKPVVDQLGYKRFTYGDLVRVDKGVLDGPLKAGKYQVRYYVKDGYCPKAVKVFTFYVVDEKEEV